VHGESKYWPFIERGSIPVLVDLTSLFAMPNTRWMRPTLGTAAYGITASPRTPARLVRWVRTSAGTWLGLCEIELTSANGQAKLEIRQLVPARLIHMHPKSPGS